MRPFSALLAIALLSVPLASAAQPRNDYLFVLDKRAGPYRYFGQTYVRALAAFGTPSKKQGEGEVNLCVVTWARAGIQIGFASQFEPCLSSNLRRSLWYGMTLFGPRWHTTRGVRVGQPVADVLERYPDATYRKGDRYLALVRRGGSSEFNHSTVLGVSLDRDGRVTALVAPAWFPY